MKRIIQFSLISTMVFGSGAGLALNPIQGFYGGGLAEVSYGPEGYPIAFRINSMDLTGTVNNSRIGAGGGVTLGYRLRNFRVEGEILFNYFTSGTLSVNTCTLHSPTLETPTGVCSSTIYNNKIGFNGSSTAAYGMVNGYFDFYTFDSESSLVPYVGFGIGEARLKNSFNFTDRTMVLSCTDSNVNTCGGSRTTTSSAAQFIVGVSEFLDDFTWIGIDYRYLTAGQVNNLNSRYSINTINFNINFSFDTSETSTA